MPESTKFAGAVGLSEGIQPRNFGGVLAGVFCMALCFIGSNTLSPWLLSHHLQLDEATHGSITGGLTALGQVITVLMAGWFGAMADVRGTRKVVVAGVAIMSLGLWVMPHATDVTSLAVARVVFSVGRAAMTACFTVLIADYALRSDLGKANAFQGTMFGLGAMVAAGVVLQTPKWFVAAGMAERLAGIAAFTLLAAVATCMALFMWLTLARDEPHAHGQRTALWTTVRRGLAQARRPAVGLAYAASFCCQASMAVVGAYLTLWTMGYGVARGMKSEQALEMGIPLLISMQVASLLLMPVFGVLTDRFGVLKGLLAGLSLASLSYLGTFLIADPSSWFALATCFVMGAAQAAMILTAQLFVQQEAPEEVRGTVIGFFSVSGASGSIVALTVGGWLFDAWHYSGPFVLAGAFDLMVLVAAVLLVPRLRRASLPQPA